MSETNIELKRKLQKKYKMLETQQKFIVELSQDKKWLLKEVERLRKLLNEVNNRSVSEGK